MLDRYDPKGNETLLDGSEYRLRLRNGKPKVEIDRSINHFALLLNVKGFNPTDVDVEIENGLMKIWAVRAHDDGQIKYGEVFSVSYILPADLDIDNLEQSIENGQLKITAVFQDQEQNKFNDTHYSD